MAEKTATAAQAGSQPAARSRQREAPPPAGLAAAILGLQQTAGNRAVGSLLGGALLQPKLRLGPPDDAYEREADRVAEAVLRPPDAGGSSLPLPVSSIAGAVGAQRMCSECEEEMRQRAAPAEDLVQRCSCQDEEDVVQPKREGGAAAATSGFERRVESLRGTGRPLPSDVRSFFEPRFGHDLGAVRVHTGGAAGEAAEAVRARAFTVGDDVVFGAGEWSPGTADGKRLLAHELTHVVQQTPVARRQPILQRSPQDDGEAQPGAEAPAPEPEAPAPAPEPAPSPGEPAPEAAAADQAPAAAVVVEDDATEVGEGQMKKGEFLTRLREEVLAAAESALSDKSRAEQAGAYVDLVLGQLEAKSAEELNGTLARLVAGEERPTTAEGYIAAVAERVRLAVATWEKTGELPQELAGGGLPGAGDLLGGLGGVFFKALPGGPRDPGDPQALRAQLGAGRPLDGGVRARMESAFGRSFSHVQVHTDSSAAGLSHRLNARAFTVGSHVAFGAGEYRPGTIVGDALMAHELAHVAQQGGAEGAFQPMRADGASYGALERDADSAAVGAVASLWGLRLPGLRLPLRAAPRLSAGLRLQRCDSCNGCDGKKATSATAPSTTPTCVPTLKSMEAKKTGSIVMTTAWRTVCELAFGEPGTPGMTFSSEVNVPPGCTGTLEYLQLVDACHGRTNAAGTDEAWKSSAFVLDTSDPYDSKPVTASGTVKYDTDDSPGTPISTNRAVGADDKFKMWLLWTPTGGSRVPLAMAEWFWKAKSTKTGKGSGCAADWTISGDSAKGSVGAATTAMPTWTADSSSITWSSGTC